MERRELSICLVESLLTKLQWLLAHLPKEEKTFKKILIQDGKELNEQLRAMKKAQREGNTFIFTNVVALFHIELGLQAMRCIT